MIIEYLRRALEASKLTQRKLSLQVIEYLDRPGLDQSLINKMLNTEGKDAPRSLQAIELKVIERLTRLEMETLIEMPVMGIIDHGLLIQPLQGVEKVPPPRDTTPQTAAVRVASDEFFPAWEKGSILYFTMGQAPEPFVHKRCVVRDAENGALYVGILRSEVTPRRWRVQSINGKTADITDLVVDWASPIEWVKTP